MRTTIQACAASRATSRAQRPAASRASIDCQRVGPIAFAQPLALQEEIFTERISLVFKKIRVVRMIDTKRNTLVYLTYSDRLIEGSPQNSVTAIAVDPSTPIPTK